MAIAFGNSSTTTPVGPVASATFNSPSVTGSNTYGIVGISGSVTTDNVSSVTWNGITMSRIAKILNTGDRNIYLYGLTSPAAGVTSIVVNSSPNGDIAPIALYYTGAQATTPADSSNTGLQANGVGNSFSVSTTTVADNAWVIGIVGDTSSGSPSSFSTGTQRGIIAGWNAMADVGPKTPAGSQAIAATWSNSAAKVIAVMSIAPLASATTTLPFKSLLGVGI